MVFTGTNIQEMVEEEFHREQKSAMKKSKNAVVEREDRCEKETGQKVELQGVDSCRE